MNDNIRNGISLTELDTLEASGCPWRPRNIDNVRSVDILCGDSVNSLYTEDGSFHPNGCCGYVPMIDDGFSCTRCGTIIWMCGWCDNYGNGNPKECDCLLLVANRKGSLTLTLLYEEEFED